MPSRSPGTPAEPAGAGRRPRSRGRPLRWAAAALLLAAAACAKEEPPPGAEPDEAPPDVREVVPADGAVVPDLDEPLRVRYDEPIEAPRGLARQLVASPLAEYRVDVGFDEIRVRPAEGWLPGAVYRIRFPGGVADLLRNEGEDSLVVTFSTGPPITDTRVSGRIVSRVDRRPQRGAVALFLAAEGDSVPYGAVADTGGRFELVSVPPGAYRAYGFRDLNANRHLERRLEPWDSATFRLEDPTAAADLRLSLLEPDSTPPRLAVAEALDSTAVSLTFDDHLDPAQSFRPSAVAVAGAGGDTVRVAAVGITRAAAGLAPADTAAAAQDTAPPADTAGAVDTAAAGGDTAAVEARAPAAGDTSAAGDTIPAGSRADTLPLPSRELFVRTARPLQDSVTYRVRVREVRNLQGLAGGGDTTFVWRPAPDTAAGADSARAAPPDPAARDTAARDSTPDGGPADSVPPDTAGRRPRGPDRGRSAP